MGKYTSSFCGSYSLETGIRAIACFYIVIYLFNIFLNIFALDIVKSYKETVDEDLEYDKTSLLAFHYIFLAFGILTILLAITTLVQLSNRSRVFMEFIFQWNIFRCVVTLVGILYVCIAMNHILTVAISCSVLVIDLCCSSYFAGIIASFIKQLDNPDALNTKESDNVKITDIHLISHKKTTDRLDRGQVPPVRVVVDSPPAHVTTETNRGVQNAGLDPETKQEVKKHSTQKQSSAAPVDGIPKEPTKVPRAKTAGEVSQPNEGKTTDNDAESAPAKHNGDAAINPTIEPSRNDDSVVIQDSGDTVETGVNNPAFEVVELNQICTEAVAVNGAKGDDKDGKVMGGEKEIEENPGTESNEVEEEAVL